ncbi:MAG: macro domain-containing protein [Lachnospiraceae bacterium]|nr:macro domain-containing protein [Lachnospiraceae bacterium]
MSFRIVRNDITRMNTDAIVNTANDQADVGTGCDSAIYHAAGYNELLSYRKEKIGPVPEGEVFITPGFRLPAKYIIHAVSPLYVNGEEREEEKLRSCYRKSLKLALENGIHSIAFPLISTGGFGYPKEEGMRIAVDEINAFLLHHEMEVFLVVFDGSSKSLGKRIFPELEEYIDENYVEEKNKEEYRQLLDEHILVDRDDYPSNAEIRPSVQRREEAFRTSARTVLGRKSLETEGVSPAPKAKAPLSSPEDAAANTPTHLYTSFVGSGLEKSERNAGGLKKDYLLGSFFKKGKQKAASKPEEQDLASAKPDLEDVSFEFQEKHESLLEERMKHTADTFSQYLMYLIQSKKMENAEVYNRAIVNKKVFSKIKNNVDYHPQKATALRLCVGAKLNLDESKDLLARAGYALSPCSKTDIIFSYFIENEIYDMIELDIQLEEHGLPCAIV